MRILSGQKQGLVNTVVSKVIADCSMLSDEGDEELIKTAQRTNGVGCTVCSNLLLSRGFLGFLKR